MSLKKKEQRIECNSDGTYTIIGRIGKPKGDLRWLIKKGISDDEIRDLAEDGIERGEISQKCYDKIIIELASLIEKEK